jgi:hypothetical protein
MKSGPMIACLFLLAASLPAAASAGAVVHPTSASVPVAEPGTMAMASMGLLALGATLRRRRGR